MGIDKAVSRSLMKRLISLSGLGLVNGGAVSRKNSDGIKK